MSLLNSLFIIFILNNVLNSTLYFLLCKFIIVKTLCTTFTASYNNLRLTSSPTMARKDPFTMVFCSFLFFNILYLIIYAKDLIKELLSFYPYRGDGIICETSPHISCYSLITLLFAQQTVLELLSMFLEQLQNFRDKANSFSISNFCFSNNTRSILEGINYQLFFYTIINSIYIIINIVLF